MDNTLNDYVRRAGEIYSYSKEINKFQKKHANELKHMISFLENTLNIVKGKQELALNIDPFSNCDDQVVPVNNLIKGCSYSKFDSDKKEIKDCEKNTNLVYIPELNQYYLKINNLVLRGNIGNIYDNKVVRKTSEIKTHQVMICAFGNNCPHVLSMSYCKFFHDPLDLLQLKEENVINNEYYQNTIKLTRNFANTSWLYSADARELNNVRTIGSKSTLNNDMKLCKISKAYRQQIENMKQQVMHDLLVLLYLNENVHVP